MASGVGRLEHCVRSEQVGDGDLPDGDAPGKVATVPPDQDDPAGEERQLGSNVLQGCLHA